MKKLFPILTFLLLSIAISAQLPVENVRLFSIIHQKDTIQFIKIDADTTQTKPTLLFCSGSQPVPLIIKQKDGNAFLTSIRNFEYEKISQKYNIIVISMPNTPVVADRKQLNSQYAYVPDTLQDHKFDSVYWENNYLEKHVERAGLVLDFLRKQTWVDKHKIILLGHSQGSHVALELARKNQDIYALGYFGGNVLGRFASTIQKERNAANTGIKSQEEAQKIIEDKYAWWKIVCRDSTEYARDVSDAKRTWKSFSMPKIDVLTSIKTPIFIAYGTKDAGAQLADIMPVFFEMAGKTNYKLRPFVGCGHNFEEIKADGSSDWDKMYWKEAVNEFLDWVENEAK